MKREAIGELEANARIDVDMPLQLSTSLALIPCLMCL